MKSGKEHDSVSAEMTAEEARELKKMFSIKDNYITAFSYLLKNQKENQVFEEILYLRKYY